MKQSEAMDIIKDPANTNRMLELFTGSSMPINEIAAAFGLTGRSGRMIAGHLKILVGEKAYHERCRRVITEGMQGKAAPVKIKICGECNSFLPLKNRINGIKYGTCKKTGKTVDRCAGCRENAAGIAIEQ